MAKDGFIGLDRKRLITSLKYLKMNLLLDLVLKLQNLQRMLKQFLNILLIIETI